MTDAPTEYPAGVRIDPRWLDPALYFQHVVVHPRFQDLDPLNHVNNAAMATLFEDARLRFNHPMRKHFQTDRVRTLVVGQTLNYVNECHLRPDLDFHLGIGRIGTSSWVLQACAWQADTPVLLAQATLVTTQDGKACPIPPALRDLLAERRMTFPA